MSDIIEVEWYKEEDYPLVQSLFKYSRDMPITYGDWLILFELRLGEIKKAGFIPLAVKVNPHKLALWCKAEGFPANSAAVAAYVRTEAKRLSGSGG